MLHIYIFYTVLITKQELISTFESTSWIPLKEGYGSYNTVFCSECELSIEGYTGFWVYKQPFAQSEQALAAMSTNTRAVKKCKLLNPGLPAYTFGSGWIMPYLGDTPASDQQIAEKLMDIYRRTQNIIVDACGKKNFLVHRGEVICVDMDQALRRGSFASDAFSKGGLLDDEQYNNYWNKYALQFGKPQTVAMIKTLLYLEHHLSAHEIRKEYITSGVLQKLNDLRIERYPEITPAIMDRLVCQLTVPSILFPYSLFGDTAMSQHTILSHMHESAFRPVKL